VFTRGVEIKTTEQIGAMREAGLVVGRTLHVLRDAVAAGVSTAELDALARDTIHAHGATSNFLNYGAGSGVPGFPGVICTSVNDQVVHGIPGSRTLRDGDIVSIDCGAIVNGWHGDAAITVAVGDVPEEVRDLLRATEEAMWRGIAAAVPGGHVGDIGHAVETFVRSQGEWGIVEGYTGHGIGTAMHQPPDVPNVGGRRRGPRLVEGMALAIEPMLTLGSPSTRVLGDAWTVVTVDGSWSAHFEHTIAITDGDPRVLTALGHDSPL
jgi:methionyl aminopeptidase